MKRPRHGDACYGSITLSSGANDRRYDNHCARLVLDGSKPRVTRTANADGQEERIDVGDLRVNDRSAPVRIPSQPSKDVVDRPDDLEHRRTLEIAWSEVSLVQAAGTDPHLERQDRISDQRKRVCQQAAANKPRGAFRHRVRQ